MWLHIIIFSKFKVKSLKLTLFIGWLFWKFQCCVSVPKRYPLDYCFHQMSKVKIQRFGILLLQYPCKKRWSERKVRYICTRLVSCLKEFLFEKTFVSCVFICANMFFWTRQKVLKTLLTVTFLLVTTWTCLHVFVWFLELKWKRKIRVLEDLMKQKRYVYLLLVQYRIIFEKRNLYVA